MEPLYLLGEPIFDVRTDGKRFQAPAGQIKLCEEIFAEEEDPDAVKGKLREEYLAIVHSLVVMGIDFRIIYAHKDMIDERVLSACVNGLGCRLAGFSEEFFGPSIVYPRDFCTVLPGVVLVNSKVVSLTSDEKDGYALISSPFGEGGRVLNSGKTMLVSERVVEENTQSRFVRDEELEQLSDLGIRSARLPCPIGGVVAGGDKNRFFSSDHVDRVGALIFDRQGNLHLTVDPVIITAKWNGRNGKPWDLVMPADTIKWLKRICDPMEIEVHTPKSMKVPYAFNLMQFYDGRVLMTSGDDDAAELISDIVGGENVHLTPAPIRYHPVWVFAGIRCMMVEAPMPLLKLA